MLRVENKFVQNFSQGRFGFKPEAFVIHIAEGSLQGGYAWFNNPASQVSSHYMVAKNGLVWQFVKIGDSAWHAGGVANPSWNLLKGGVNPNFYTIGIEHEGFTGEPWTEAMYLATAEIIGIISRDLGIPIDRDHIIGHYKINSVGRSRCPGTGVDFNKLINLALTFVEDPKMIQELQNTIASLQNKLSIERAAKKDLEDKVKALDLARQDLQQKVQVVQKENEQLKLASANVKVIEQRNILLANEVKTLQNSQKKLNARIIALEKQLNG